MMFSSELASYRNQLIWKIKTLIISAYSAYKRFLSVQVF